MLPYIYHIQQVQIPDVPDMMCFSLPVFCVFSKKIVSKLSKCYRSRDSSIHLSSMDLNTIQIYFTFFAFYTILIIPQNTKLKRRQIIKTTNKWRKVHSQRQGGCSHRKTPPSLRLLQVWLFKARLFLVRLLDSEFHKKNWLRTGTCWSARFSKMWRKWGRKFESLESVVIQGARSNVEKELNSWLFFIRQFLFFIGIFILFFFAFSQAYLTHTPEKTNPVSWTRIIQKSQDKKYL